MTADNRLIDWAIDETRKKYASQISILLEHNTYCLEEDRNVRYVNTIISDADPFVGLARTFIINGIGYDFQQRTWESFERDADAKGYYLTVLAEAKIIYSRNEADRQRFLYLRAKLMANLADFNYMFQRGLEWLDNAMELYKTMAFETGLCKMRKAVGYISDSLCMAVACLNQTYFKGFNQLEELKRMKHIPQDFLVYCQQMLQNSDEEALKSIAYRMIQTTRKLFYSMEPRIAPAVVHPDYTYVAEWYQECSYYFRRVYAFCAQGDASLAFGESFRMQTDLDDLARDFGITGLDLLTCFNAEDLAGFAQHVKLVEQRIVDAIQSNHVTIEDYASVDEFLEKNV